MRQSIDQLCHCSESNTLITKDISFGQGIALFRASADFPLPNPQKGASENEFQRLPSPLSSPDSPKSSGDAAEVALLFYPAICVAATKFIGGQEITD